jgi:hypothetical protein
MLDNIVTDGMRFTAEVRRRMDEAQKELDRGATTRGTEDDDDEEGDEGGRDLLEGAEADAGREMKSEHGELALLDKGMAAEPQGKSPTGGASSEVEKSTMFER